MVFFACCGNVWLRSCSSTFCCASNRSAVYPLLTSHFHSRNHFTKRDNNRRNKRGSDIFCDVVVCPLSWYTYDLPSSSETLRQSDHACCTILANRLMLMVRSHSAVHNTYIMPVGTFEYVLIVGVLSSPLFLFSFISFYSLRLLFTPQ
jgi:hypothetical protein